MTDFEKFKEQLKSKKMLYTSLTVKKKISEKEYDHVFQVWNKFEVKKMIDYHDLYLKCEVLLFADVFEKIINNSIKNYGLCPSSYLSTPALSWNAMLSTTKVELELIPDPDTYIFFEKGIRSGVFIFL